MYLFFDIFLIWFVIFFQSCYLISHIQKVSTHCKEQNKKIMTIGYKTKKLFKVKKWQKMPKKLNIFCLKKHEGAGI